MGLRQASGRSLIKMEIKYTTLTHCKELELFAKMEAEAQRQEEEHAHGMEEQQNGYTIV